MSLLNPVQMTNKVYYRKPTIKNKYLIHFFAMVHQYMHNLN